MLGGDCFGVLRTPRNESDYPRSSITRRAASSTSSARSSDAGSSPSAVEMSVIPSRMAPGSGAAGPPGIAGAQRWADYLDWVRAEMVRGVLALSYDDQRRSLVPSGWTPLELLNLSALLEDSARKHPDRDAVVLGQTRLSYARVDAAANQVATEVALWIGR